MSFLKERLLVAGFGLAATGAFVGLAMIRSVPRYRDRYSREPNYASWESYTEARESWYGLGLWVLGGSLGFALLLGILGLVIALGLGPSWMAKTVHGVRVEERLLHYPDGTTHYNRAPLSDCSVRCYVRVRLPNGTVTELSTDEDTYRRLKLGTEGSARMVGRRLVDFYVKA
jgi:hypothetical protein